MHQPAVFQNTLQKTHSWLIELQQLGPFRDTDQAYVALRGVLHALRDRLVVDEAAQLAAELPMLVRGAYFEGWKPAHTPCGERTREEFLDCVREAMRNDTVDPEKACRAVFMLLSHKVSEGELSDVRRMLPKEIQALWPHD